MQSPDELIAENSRICWRPPYRLLAENGETRMASYDPSSPKTPGQVFSVRAEANDRENQFTWGDRALLWLSGSDAHSHAKSPPATLNKQKALGMVTAVPAVLAALSIAAFLSTQGFGLPIVIVGCLIWPLFVLAIDRALLATYSAEDPPAAKRAKLIVRISMALLIGVIVAHPLTLWQFREMIRDRFEQIKGEQIRAIEAARDAQIVKVQTSNGLILDDLKRTEDDSEAHFNELLRREMNANPTAEGAAALREEGATLKVSSDKLRSQRKELNDQLTEANRQKAEFQNYLRQELLTGTNDYNKAQGDKHVTRPGREFTAAEQQDPIKCPKTAFFYRKIQEWDERIRYFTTSLGELDKAETKLKKEEADTNAAVEKRRTVVQGDQEAGLAERVHAIHENRDRERAQLAARRLDKTARAAEDEKNVAADYNQRLEKLRRRVAPDTFQQTAILFKEVFNPSDDIDAALGSSWTRIVAGTYELTKFLILFLVLDIVPIVIKVMGGDFGPPATGRSPGGGGRRRPPSTGSSTLPRPPGAYDIDS